MYIFVTLNLAMSHNPIDLNATNRSRVRMYRYYDIFIRTGFNLKEITRSL